ncbi:hypothetical protein PR048_021966, partial [Dryococelus australis]
MLQKSGCSYGCQMDITNSKKKLKIGESKHIYHLRLSSKLLAPILYREEVEELMLQELYGEVLDDLAKFNISFWELAKQKHPAISRLAIKLLNNPVSSAQLERAFIIGRMSTAPFETHLR